MNSSKTVEQISTTINQQQSSLQQFNSALPSIEGNTRISSAIGPASSNGSSTLKFHHSPQPQPLSQIIPQPESTTIHDEEQSTTTTTTTTNNAAAALTLSSGLSLFQMKKVLQSDLVRISDKFQELKHRLYTNKERLLERELSQLENSQHPMLKQQLNDLKLQRNRRVEVSQLRQKFIQDSLQFEHLASSQAALHNFNESKKSIRRKLIRKYQRMLVNVALEYNQSFLASSPYPGLTAEVVYDNSGEMGYLPGHLEALSKAEVDSDLGMIVQGQRA